MSTPANRKRALERINCREELSEHLKNKLSILVAPAEVRLHPLNTDKYRWHFKDSKRYLFTNQLSKLSTNAYIEIRRALTSGDIWAVLQDGLQPSNKA
ncbi:hypothetical protein BDV37DRAFT_280391 [Aspergillus pseudonomiae]|uniref:Uncharacterized protein n=1 Tax=Aspergillus pseudonomiae TaxID=1506151 RepID=A0A5N7DM96_9EURO|nr:uncharacterized protein BDV37DRAFT_280391 [Aspergillus pseudonomiae]KAE8407133.1 hypothetical protein BDV37DRAFT_280391 [Aspergillus pseudonomiae]